MKNSSLNSKLANRYARALILVGEEKNIEKKIGKEVDSFLSSYKADKKFETIFTNPLLSASNQEEIVKNIFDMSDNKKIKICKEFFAFLMLLAKNSRLQILEETLQNYKQIVLSNNQFLNISITSTSAMSAVEIENIEAMISKKTKKKISVENIIDSSIIGGLILKIGSKLIDASLRAKIDRINTIIKGEN